MSLDAVRMVAHVHGHMGWLSAAALTHPALLLRHPGRRAHAAVASSTSLATVSAGLGAWLYVAYRQQIRPVLFATRPAVAFVFERKEHLAFAALMLSWAGAAAYVAALHAEPPVKAHLRRAAALAYGASAAFAILVATLGTIVAIERSF